MCIIFKRVGFIAALAAACSVPGAEDEVEGPNPAAPAPDWGSIGGVVTHDFGAPLALAHLVTTPGGYETTTNDVGRFAIDRLDPGTYTLAVQAAGYDPDEVSEIRVVAGEAIDVAVDLAATESLDGSILMTALGPDGLPLVGAIVTVDGGPSAIADVDGVARITGLASQTVDLAVADADGLLWERRLRDVAVPSLGAVHATVQLSGRPSDGSRYLGSHLCAMCHEQGAHWEQSRHAHTLTEEVDGAILAAFAQGQSVDLPGGIATLSLNVEQPEVTVTADLGEARTFEVGGLIGDPSQGTVPWVRMGEQTYPLPLGWSAGDPAIPDWPDTDPSWVAFQPERWLTEGGTFRFDLGETPDPASSAERMCLGCHATGFQASLRDDGGVDLASTAGGGEPFLEPGVGCERCHGPGGSHMDAFPAEKPFRITRPDLLDADRANEVCAQCHAHTEGHGTGLPFPYAEPGGLFLPGSALDVFGSSQADLWPSGASAKPNGQADELAWSAHGPSGPYTLRCFDCHASHGTEQASEPLPAELRQPTVDNTLCVNCHLGLTFDHDQAALEDHSAHFTYDPTGPASNSRCTRCHMPGTTARLAWHESSGAGDLASHRFAALPPQDTLDLFDAAGADTLPIGAFPAHSCGDCHASNAWRWAEAGAAFIGPHGDPTQRTTQESFQAGYEEKYP